MVGDANGDGGGTSDGIFVFGGGGLGRAKGSGFGPFLPQISQMPGVAPAATGAGAGSSSPLEPSLVGRRVVVGGKVAVGGE